MQTIPAIVLGAFILGLLAYKPARWVWHTMFTPPAKGFEWHWNDRRELYKLNRFPRADIVFVGDSIARAPNWAEVLNCPYTLNWAYNGERADQLLERIDDIAALSAKAVFVVIGTNDLYANRSAQDTIRDIKEIASRLSPSDVWLHTVPNQPEFNALLKEAHTNVIDISGIEMEGYHPTHNGYRAWRDMLIPVVEKYYKHITDPKKQVKARC